MGNRRFREPVAIRSASNGTGSRRPRRRASAAGRSRSPWFPTASRSVVRVERLGSDHRLLRSSTRPGGSLRQRRPLVRKMGLRADQRDRPSNPPRAGRGGRAPRARPRRSRRAPAHPAVVRRVGAGAAPRPPSDGRGPADPPSGSARALHHRAVEGVPDPWHGQSQVRSASFQSTVHPMCVHRGDSASGPPLLVPEHRELLAVHADHPAVALARSSTVRSTVFTISTSDGTSCATLFGTEPGGTGGHRTSLVSDDDQLDVPVSASSQIRRPGLLDRPRLHLDVLRRRRPRPPRG